ncbi:MAG: N-acetyltransferase [Candidatus Cloacimonadales bacterium]
MQIEIRLANPQDYREIELLTRAAFWDIYAPGCDEHLLVHKLHQDPDYIPQLDFVAISADKIVGHIIYSKSQVVSDDKEQATITFGPLSVDPDFQGRGIGSLLVRHSLQIAQNLGYQAVIIFGDPQYYSRFGFVNAQKFGISTAEGENMPDFMALELIPQSLSQTKGKFYLSKIFAVDAEELLEFEQNFPVKSKRFGS